MHNIQLAQRFEKVVMQLFNLLNYETHTFQGQRLDTGIDIVAAGVTKHYIEVKFYRSLKVSSAILKDAANAFAYRIQNFKDGFGILVVNTMVTKQLKDEILDVYGLAVWDREIIYNHLTVLSLELRDEFENLLLAAQQGTETYDVFQGIKVQDVIAQTLETPEYLKEPKFNKTPSKSGAKLCKELKDIPCGKEGWTRYETKCLEILNFLFGQDLLLWEKQPKTDDGLSRFDLVCRVASKDDYWKALVASFNSRFVLFEFKNYCDPIGQDQVYTTERYLYIKGLRSVGFIIARNGATVHAQVAAKGALKEHGKLIMILSGDDLCNMLHLKDNNESPNDYLSNHLDSWLIGLSR